MEVIALVVLALFFVLLLKITGKSRQARMLEYLPGPPGYPLLGNSLDFLGPREKRMQVMLSRDAKYGPIYKSWIGPKAFVHISSPELIEVMLGSTVHIQKGAIYRFLRPWLGNGLLTSHGGKWTKHRKLITPTFHFKILESFIEVFNENAQVLVGKLAKRATAETSASTVSRYFDIYPFITLCALDIICETAMGTKVNAQLQDSSTYVTALNKVAHFTLQRFNKMWLHNDFIFPKTATGKTYYKNLKVLHDFTNGVISERKASRKCKSKEKEEEYVVDDGVGRKTRKAFLDLLLDASEEDAGSKLTDTEIREEVDTFMFEGHDTTTSGMCWAIFLLGNNQAIQDGVVDELSRIFQDDPDRLPTMQDLAEMKYLERVIKEALRLFPVVPFISRELTEDLKLGDYVIPYGTSIYLHLYTLHRDQRTFKEPETFNPDHFLPENLQKRHPYAYAPFSAGPRNCIGQKFALLEEKAILSSILRRFKIESKERREDLTLVNELILRPKSGVQVRLTKRS